MGFRLRKNKTNQDGHVFSTLDDHYSPEISLKIFKTGPRKYLTKKDKVIQNRDWKEDIDFISPPVKNIYLMPRWR